MNYDEYTDNMEQDLFLDEEALDFENRIYIFRELIGNGVDSEYYEELDRENFLRAQDMKGAF